MPCGRSSRNTVRVWEVFAVAGADATTRVVFAPAVKSKNRVPFDNFRAESLTR